MLSINPSCIAQVKEAAQYDTSITFDENMARYLTIIEALQPHDLMTGFQKLEKLKDMTRNIPKVRRSLENY